MILPTGCGKTTATFAAALYLAKLRASNAVESGLMKKPTLVFIQPYSALAANVLERGEKILGDYGGVTVLRNNNVGRQAAERLRRADEEQLPALVSNAARSTVWLSCCHMCRAAGGNARVCMQL